MNDSLLAVAIASDLVIGLGYIALGLLLASKFDAAAPTLMLALFKAAGLLFLLLGAATRLDLAYHTWSDTLFDPLAAYALVGHALQAVAAVVAAGIGWGFISLRIYDRTVYLGLLDREIDRQARLVAARVRAGEVDALAKEARRLCDAAELIRAAYGRQDADDGG